MFSEEGHDLAAHLQPRDIGVQVEPVDAIELEADVAVQKLLDVDHQRYALRHSAQQPALSARQTVGHISRVGGWPGGTCPPSPLPLNVGRSEHVEP